MAKRQLDELVVVCRHHNIGSFNLRDENGRLRFPNMCRVKRESMLFEVFLKRAVLNTPMQPSRTDLVVAVMDKFVELWRHINCDFPELDKLQASVVAFTLRLRKSLASDEVPNYVHLLCLDPLLV